MNGAPPAARAAGPPDAVVTALLVDDSAAIRRIVGTTLNGEPDIEVIGTARDGLHAITQASLLSPDVVVLDVEMPNLDGLSALPRLLEATPHLPVVMYSSLTERGASAALDALARGAVDYATKPTMVASQEDAMASIRRDLVPLVRTWGRIHQVRRGRRATVTKVTPEAVVERVLPAQPPALGTHRPTGRHQRASAIIIGSSTGGPNALTEVIPSLPAGLTVPVLIVQHMPEVFTKLLADRLNARSLVSVLEAQQDQEVRPGHVYIAQGGTHLSVRRDGGRTVIDCGDGPPENFCRPAVDVMFRSAVQVWGSGVLAVMLTGMGSDGLQGSRGVVAAGGTVIAQDEATSVVWGMPGAVARDGLASEILPLSGVAEALVERTMAPTRRILT